MNKTDAKEYAEKVTLEDLQQMFENAQAIILPQDWMQVSFVNKGMTKGVAYNILSKGIKSHKSINEINNLAKVNMIREFGEFLPNYKKKIKAKKSEFKPFHQEPNFDNI